MIVCHCTGITDRDIRSLVRKGRVASAREIGRECSAGHGCGGCRLTIAQIVDQEERSRAETVLIELAPAL
ncbi:MAG TPA: (2Fe-2S)-binding protein [Vicinamibacteria bacterium]|nr:(2Fe-2S)-binding protein [Vicinamibacteria bacterium]